MLKTRRERIPPPARRMRVGRLRRLAARVGRLPHYTWRNAVTQFPDTPIEGFNLAMWKGRAPCGTAGCIAGCACEMWPQEADPAVCAARGEATPGDTAARILGLPPDQAKILFTPRSVPGVGSALVKVPPRRAARAIRALASGATGRDMWAAPPKKR